METRADHNTVTKTTTLRLLKSTGNTHVYQEETRERHKQIFPTIYVQKQNFMPAYDSPPETIQVTLSWEPKA